MKVDEVRARAISGSLNGNATTASRFQTARTIGGVSFDGTGNINLPGVNTAGNQNTSGNAAAAVVAKNQSGGTVNAATGTFSGKLNSPSFNQVAFTQVFTTTATSTTGITNNTDDSIIYYTVPVPYFARYSNAVSEGGVFYGGTWRVIVEYRWFGEIGGGSNENIMWDAELRVPSNSAYTVYSAKMFKTATEISNRNAGCTTHALNQWRDHYSTPEVMNLSCSFDFGGSFNSVSDDNVTVHIVVRNRSGSNITVATNRTIGDLDGDHYERGCSFLKVTFLRDIY